MPAKSIESFITPLSVNGLDGRMMELPAPAKRDREILVVCGYHSSLERMYGYAKCFNRYGSVCVVDLPGFGGMDSFYSIGKRPTIDNLADYLAAVIKLKFKKRPLTIIGFSLAFAVVTRMLQKYPKMVGQIELCVSITGFVHRDDFRINHTKRNLLSATTRVMAWRLPSLIAKGFLRASLIRWVYLRHAARYPNPKETADEQKYRIDFAVWLWQNNDIRTYFFTLGEMCRMNLCHSKVDLTVYHVAADNDQYLDNHIVEQHMRVIFNDFIALPLAKPQFHSPPIVATAREAGAYVPPRLRRLLAQSARKLPAE